MDVEHLLLSRIIQDKDYAPIADASISQKFFEDSRNQQVFETITRHVNEYGVVPTLAAIKADYPEYKFVKVDEPVAFLIDKIREQRQYSLLQDGISSAVDAYESSNLFATKAALHDALNQVERDVPNTRDTDITITGQDRLDRYQEYKKMAGHLRGAPTGFSSLDRATNGWQKENLVFMVGPPKAGKSTLLLLAAIAAHNYGLRPLLFTFEMSSREVEERMDAIRSGISHRRLQSGDLKAAEWKRLRRYLNQLEDMPPFWFSADSHSATTLTGISAKVDQIKPDIVFVDGVYMLIDEITGESNTSQSLTNLTRGFKRLAQNKQVPIVATTQVLLWKMDKKKGVTANSIGYSSSFAQDADTILGVMGTEDDTIQKITTVLGRNVPAGLETFVEWDWDNGKFEELMDNPFNPTGEGGWDDQKSTF